MIMQTPESNLRTLFNLIEKKLRDLDTKHITIFKQERGYKILEGELALDPGAHLRLIALKQFESIEAALEAFIIHGEISNNEG